MQRRLVSVLCLLSTTALAGAAATRPAATAAASQPAPRAAAPRIPLDDASIPREVDTASLGLRLPRTMAMLEASGQGNTTPIRILFYGQSIVAQFPVQLTLVNELRHRFPKARLVHISRAIGGYEAPLLVRTMVHDVVSFAPDLIVFDDYVGQSREAYEQIIRYLRSQTAAEVLLWSPHLDNLGPNNPGFAAKMDKDRDAEGAFRREMAAKYGCEFADLRDVWRRYLEEQKLPRTALLADGLIHNNNPGCELIGKILARHFVHNPAARLDDSVRVIRLADTAAWSDNGVKVEGPWKPLADGQGIELAAPGGRMELQFTGVRVDIVGPRDAKVARGQVLIDGQAPSSVLQAWTISRPSAGPFGWFPAVNHVSFGSTPPVKEDWTLHFYDVAKDGKTFRFRLAGSVTGPDGEGDSTMTEFTSTSKRLRFELGDVTLAKSARVTRKEYAAEFDVSWRTFPLGQDEYLRKPGDVNDAAERQPLVNALPAGPHRLTLVSQGPSPLVLRELIIHRPPVK